jgi:hypothetical protein
MTFLNKDYEVPKSNSNYTKLQDGENTFRVLGSAIVGWQYWTKDKKPVRQKEVFTETPEDAKLDNGQFKPKHFWAFPVWNYEEKAVQIYEVTQATIQQAIMALVKNEKWGDPKGYDISITKTGADLETKYAVMPNPHTELSSEIAKAYEDKKINLEALYTGENPFGEKETPEVSAEDNPLSEDAF